MYSVIIGGGKIGRGFIADVLYLARQEFCIIDQSRAFVEAMNRAGSYTVHILGSPEKDTVIRGVPFYDFADTGHTGPAIAKADNIFTAVGGKNLPALVEALQPLLEERFRGGCRKKFNIITCENWKAPAKYIYDELLARMKGWEEVFRECCGVAESVVMRSGIECRESALDVNAQDYWELPIDAAALKAPLPEVPAFRPMDHFGGFLERKFYTFNAANGTVSYLGSLLGYEFISDAASDPYVEEVLDGVYRETSAALCKKQGCPFQEQWEFTRASYRKLHDKAIVDTLERNARDPIRKLSPTDRLVGPAQMALEYGVMPEHLCISIAAALYYTSEADESAVRLQALRRSGGVDTVLREICGLDPEGTIGTLVKKQIKMLQARGYCKDA